MQNKLLRVLRRQEWSIQVILMEVRERDLIWWKFKAALEDAVGSDQLLAGCSSPMCGCCHHSHEQSSRGL